LEVKLYLSFATGLDKYYGLLDVMRGLGVVVLDGKTYKDFNGESLGFAKVWRKKKDVWAKLLPELESRIQTEWKYSNEEAPFEDEDIDEDSDDESEEVEETPLQKLKNTKKKVTAKLDKIEGEADVE
jgi:hypothetical protein